MSSDKDILHVDLDAFYAGVEILRRPDLKGKPVVVGGRGPRGVVLSCSYEARSKGVRNGMPGMRARRLCPEAVFVPPDFDAYTSASKRFREVLLSFTPRIEPISLDEAFCDVSGAHRMYGSTPQVAAKIRKRVLDELGLVCSVGGGPSKLVAKLASRACKPDGLLVPDDHLEFLHGLPVEEIWGVGEATASVLRRLGIRSVAELAATPVWVLQQALGDQLGPHLAKLARGEDGREVVAQTESKSVGAEQTFDRDLASPDRLHAEILRLADRVASRLAATGTCGRTVTVKIRLASFATHTRSRTLPSPTQDVWTIFAAARDAFDGFHRGRERVRLLGVSVSGLTPGPAAEQLSFERRPSYARAEQAVVRVRKRFGEDAVRMARLLDEGGTRGKSGPDR
ncbi:MAG TPA: DNA polymerase IV [Actinomycetota bacterium]|nr:DNA polymerase IV [Actinomycetota bacterium]